MLVVSLYFLGDGRQLDIPDLQSLPLGPHPAELSEPCGPQKSLAVNPLLNLTVFSSTGQQFWVRFVVTSDDSQHAKINLSYKRTQLLSPCLFYLVSVSLVASRKRTVQENKKRPQIHLLLTVTRGEIVWGHHANPNASPGLFVPLSIHECCSWNSSSMYIPAQHF